MNQVAILGIVVLVAIVVAYSFSGSGSTKKKVFASVEEIELASKLIKDQLEKEAKDALPSSMKPNVDDLGLEDTERIKLVSLLDTHKTPGPVGNSLLGSAAPGTREHYVETMNKLKEMSGFGAEIANVHAYPKLEIDTLKRMVAYAKPRGIRGTVVAMARVVVYKKVLAIGKTVGLNLEEFKPHLGGFLPTSIDLPSLELEKLKELLEAFSYHHDPPTHFKDVINVLRPLIHSIENGISEAELKSQAEALEQKRIQERLDAKPGTQLYREVTYEKMRTFVVKDFPLGDKNRLPQLHPDVLKRLITYAKSRGAHGDAIRFSNTIAYKDSWQVGKSVGTDMNQFKPDLLKFTPTSIKWETVDISIRQRFLDIFKAHYRPPLNYRNVISALEASIENDPAPIKPGSAEYKQETLDQIFTMSGITTLKELVQGEKLNLSISDDVLIQIREYAESRGEPIMVQRVDRSFFVKKLDAVGKEMGVDLLRVPVWDINLEEVELSHVIKLENLLLSDASTNPNMIQFLEDVKIFKAKKAEESVIVEELEEEAVEEKKEEIIEEIKEVNPETTNTSPVTDKKGRVTVTSRENSNGSAFMDLNVPSDLAPEEADKITIFVSKEDSNIIDDYQKVYKKIKQEKSIQNLTTEEIDTISDAGKTFNSFSSSYVRQRKGKIDKRVSTLSV